MKMWRKLLLALAGLSSPAFAQFYSITPQGAIPFANTNRYLTSVTSFLYGVSTQQLEQYAGSAALPAYTYSGPNNQTTGTYLSNTNEQSIATNGVQRSLTTNNGLSIFLGGVSVLGAVQTSLGLSVQEGSNAKQGTTSLSGTSTLIANTSITAKSRIFLTGVGSSNVAPWLIGVTAGVGFSVGATGAGNTVFFISEGM